MLEVKNVGGFLIKMGDNSNRYIKAYDIYGSTDNLNWTLLKTDDNAPAKSSFRVILDKAADIRYFKLLVRETRANDGPFVRIYEVDVTSGAVAGSESGILLPKVDEGLLQGDGKAYNLGGQKINGDTNGIVIKNGKKYMQKKE